MLVVLCMLFIANLIFIFFEMAAALQVIAAVSRLPAVLECPVAQHLTSQDDIVVEKASP